MQNKTTALTLAVFLTCAGAGMCGEQKIAVVDMNRILKNHPVAMKARERLNEQLKEYESQRDQMLSELGKKKDGYDDARRAADNKALTDEQRTKLQDAAEEKFRELKEFDAKMRSTLTSKEKDLTDEDARVSKKILGEIRDVIGEYSGKKGYTLVLDSSSIGLTRIGTVIFADAGIDITEDILKIIAKKPEEKK